MDVSATVPFRLLVATSWPGCQALQLESYLCSCPFPLPTVKSEERTLFIEVSYLSLPSLSSFSLSHSFVETFFKESTYQALAIIILYKLHLSHGLARFFRNVVQPFFS